ncbi:MAG: hypothetical protein H2212_03575 [Ruminococcus sp.]|nr:hypothetical protein [Ruminococcus sp.]
MKTIYKRWLSGLLSLVIALLSAFSLSVLLPTEIKAATIGDVRLEIGERVEYSGYSTNYFYINGNLAYCLEPAKATPTDGSYATDVVHNNDLLAKALYYVEGAPGATELGAGFWQMPNPDIWGVSPFGERYAYCHMFLAWIYNGFDFNVAFAGTSILYNPELLAALQSDFQYRKSVIEGKTVADVSLQITPETGKATWDLANGIQRTEDFTLHGDYRNSVTIPAPSGATIHNKETGQKGASVTVNGGQHFYLTSGTTTAGTYTSSEISGSMTTQWAGIIFNRNNSDQTMGGWSAYIDPVDPVTFKVQWADRGQVRILKESTNPSATHDGVDDQHYTFQDTTFGIYQGTILMETVTTNAAGEALSSPLPAPFIYTVKELSPPKGYLINTTAYDVDVKEDQTTNVTVSEKPQMGRILLHKRNARTNAPEVYNSKYTLKDAKYSIKNSKGSIVGTLVTAANGDALSNDIPFGTYTMQESSPSVGFLKDPTVYTVTITAENQTAEIFTKEVVSLEQEQKGKIVIQKVDSETGEAKPQGSASLKNAIYDIFKKANYKENDNTTSPSYICSVTTNEAGRAETPEIFLDDYYVLERTPSGGYLLDKTRYEVSLTSENRTDAVFTKSVTSKEDVIRGDVQIAKFFSDLDGEDENDIKKPGEGIEFSFESVTTNKVVCTIITNKDGFATTVDKDYPRGSLPVDEYIVREKNTPAGFIPITPFRVKITEEGVTLGYIIENRNIVSAISVVKRDAGTGDIVPAAGTEFRILDKNKELITMKTHYPKNEVHESFFTDERGSFILPERLPVGTYYLDELNAPKGMLLGELLKFEVKEDSSGDWEDPLIVDYYNENVKGQITLKKTDSDTKQPVPGAVYGLYAAKDIVTADTTIRAQKDDLVAKGTTNENGEIIYDNLYLGDYYQKEISPAPGYTLDSKTYPVVLEYIDQETPIVKETVKVKNNPTKLQILKVDKITKKPLSGVSYEFWEKAVDSSEVDPEMAVKEHYTTDEDGLIELSYLVPGTYCLKEEETEKGYVLDNTIHEIAVGQDGMIDGEEIGKITLKNDYTKVRFSKTDITTGKELSGAKLRIEDTEGKTVIPEWKTGKEPKQVDKLVPGKYFLIESSAPAGFVVSEKVEFEVKPTGEIQKVKMEDDVIKVEVSKTDITTGKELPGAELEIQDPDGKTIEKWTSEEIPKRIDKLPAGKYVLVEKTAPTGYATAEKVEFEVEPTGEIQKVKMEDDVIKVEVSKTDIITGKELPGAELEIQDSKGKTIEKWTSEEKPKRIDKLPVGKYELVEKTAPSGYKIAKNVEFEVNDTTEIQKVTMKDAPEGKVLIKTGDSIKDMLPLVGLCLLTGGVIAAVIWRKVKSKGSF